MNVYIVFRESQGGAGRESFSSQWPKGVKTLNAHLSKSGLQGVANEENRVFILDVEEETGVLNIEMMGGPKQVLEELPDLPSADIPPKELGS